MIVACASFPFGWNSDEFRKICGPEANRFDAGLCGIRWAYALAIIGKTFVRFIQPSPWSYFTFFSMRRRLHSRHTRFYSRHETHSTAAWHGLSKGRRCREQCIHYRRPLARRLGIAKIVELEAGSACFSATHAAPLTLDCSRWFYFAILEPERHKPSALSQSHAPSSIPALNFKLTCSSL